MSTEWGGSRWREGEDNVVTTCMVLSWGCKSVTRSSPAVQLQHLMSVETLTCRCGNLELSPTSNFPLLSGNYRTLRAGPSHLSSRRNQVNHYLQVPVSHWRGHPECQLNLDTSYYRDGIRWDQSSLSLWFHLPNIPPKTVASITGFRGKKQDICPKECSYHQCLGRKCTICMKIRLEAFKSDCWPLIMAITVFCINILFLNFMTLFKVYLLW